jgi:hypothetical protein
VISKTGIASVELAVALSLKTAQTASSVTNLG